MVEAGGVGGDGQGLHRHADRGQRGPQVGLGVHRVHRAGGLDPAARRRTRPYASGDQGLTLRGIGQKGRADFEQIPHRRSRARRCARRPTPGWRAASDATGRDRRRSGSAAAARPASSPNRAACACAMKLKVTHSARPCAARVRRATRAAGLARGDRRAGDGGGARQRDGRNRIEAAQAQHFLDQVAFGLDRRGAGGGGLRAGGVEAGRLDRAPAWPRRRCARTGPIRSRWRRRVPGRRSRGVSSDATASSAGTSRPPNPARRSKRKVALRCQAGSAPAAVTALASPPHSRQHHLRWRPRSHRAAARDRCRARSAGGRRR